MFLATIFKNVLLILMVKKNRSYFQYYCGLMIKSGISETDGYDDTIFGGFLIILNGLLILVIIPGTLLIHE